MAGRQKQQDRQRPVSSVFKRVSSMCSLQFIGAAARLDRSTWSAFETHAFCAAEMQPSLNKHGCCLCRLVISLGLLSLAHAAVQSYSPDGGNCTAASWQQAEKY